MRHCLNKHVKDVTRITFLCNIYPVVPYCYIAKLGYAGVYLFLFLFLLQTIDCGNRNDSRSVRVKVLKYFLNSILLLTCMRVTKWM